MTVESVYWKEQLSKISKALRPVDNPRRFSERYVCETERDITVGFFLLRRMIELQRVTCDISEGQILAYRVPASRVANLLNRHRIEENYDWPAEKQTQLPIRSACNQFMHFYLLELSRGKNRNWVNAFVVSDFDRLKYVWRVPVATIAFLFDQASKSYPHSIRATYDSEKTDYSVEVDPKET